MTMKEGCLKKGDPFFPEKLLKLKPEVKELYYQGDLTLLDGPAAAIVGSRRCTRYGRVVAKALGKKAAASDIAVISGLAKGIDAAAHTGALEAGGRTIAVLGGGTSCFYPPENRRLQIQIAEEGLLISEHEPDYQVRAFDFPLRNRIIAALADSLVVVEAGNRSGALITAECAADLGRNVYAVPGNITSLYSFGSNKLIRDGAMPLILMDDLITDMGVVPYINEDSYQGLGRDERRVFDVIRSGGETTVEEIHHRTDMKLSEINGIITILEIKGLIFSSMGKIFVAKF